MESYCEARVKLHMENTWPTAWPTVWAHEILVPYLMDCCKKPRTVEAKGNLVYKPRTVEAT